MNNLTTRKMECYSVTSIAMSEAAMASVRLSGLDRERKFYATPKLAALATAAASRGAGLPKGEGNDAIAVCRRGAKCTLERAHPHLDSGPGTRLRGRPVVLLPRRRCRVRHSHRIRQTYAGHYLARSRIQVSLSERANIRSPAFRLRLTAERVSHAREDAGRCGRDGAVAGGRSPEVL